MTTTGRPEDIANHEYYSNGIRFRRARVTLDVEVEWRGDDGYSFAVIGSDLTGGSIRLNPFDPSSVEWVDDIIRDRQHNEVGRVLGD